MEETMNELSWNVLFFVAGCLVGCFVGLCLAWKHEASAWHSVNELGKTVVLLTSQNVYLLSQLRPNDGEEWKQGGGYQN